MYADELILSAYICVHPPTSAVKEIPIVYNISRDDFDRQFLIPIQNIDRPADLNTTKEKSDYV
ncbi:MULTISPECIES: hypothetical protein [unclassified Microcoleus]|uniref:hypothetical protein n=1 Tax=unclassified Microcoleus TaxID=2642155 RepID=UPI0025D3C6C4|nr:MULTISPECIES: hypothetical protein [unclassified Microcoleus]